MKIHFTIAALLLTTCSVHAQYTKYIQAVDEYVPAPGQFVNTLPQYEDGNTAADMAQKCTECIAAGKGDMITLGAYGGYVTFHFDHPVANLPGQKDFAVWGNAFYDNSEPAIVMVSVDENQNGLPDDTWYELAGSEYYKSGTVHGYVITYTYDAMKDIQWTDNQSCTGSVPRNEYHEQEYFPLWLTATGTLSFQGTLLPPNAVKWKNTYILSGYDYGYADNWPNSDRDGCSMNIEWAVDAEGNSVQLDHIDFVRCYTAVNQVCGAIGETSSEITGAEDLHLDESIATYLSETPCDRQQTTTEETGIFDLQGRRISRSTFNAQRSALPRGLYITNGRKVLIQ